MAAQGDYVVAPAPFPAKTLSTTERIKGKETSATTMYFADKIMITISQDGRLAHWVHVPLDVSATDDSITSNPYVDRDDDEPSSDLLPMHHLTATTILGGTVQELDVLGQTLSTQIGSAIKTRNPSETRMLVMGLGLDKSMSGREEYSELVGLVLGAL
ncbi:hypothetical protein BS50DRAFT_570256 [Corynespora cassiicola Philippines]|uniref:Proteasome assembly chaperone 3 n=1 Tax=Corynespora cassiicola Philippines TaxID=1448308 RepID=A0A2T2NZA0_CORCC|nr:hypothetical protein BS50DRAFT_570256 [Corynespora cassiicola Philippines]